MQQLTSAEGARRLMLDIIDSTASDGKRCGMVRFAGMPNYSYPDISGYLPTRSWFSALGFTFEQG